MKDRAKRLDRKIELQLGTAERIDAPARVSTPLPAPSSFAPLVT